ncbi:MAG: hypothetical protein ACRCU2_10015, partial [Planktothrix sp.]
STQLEIHPAILFFYSTQWLYPEQLLGSNHQKNLKKISVTLGCCIEDLKDIEINISTLNELELNQIYEPFQEENKEQDNADSIIKSGLSNNENLSSLPSDFLELTLSSPILESFHRWESQGSMVATSSLSCLTYLACLKVAGPGNCGPKPPNCNVSE